MEMEKQKGYLTVVVFGDENVLGLDITMYYFVKMDYTKKREKQKYGISVLERFRKGISSLSIQGGHLLNVGFA